ncbi:hypothetical protein OSTOST_13103 [Ostertagia ostertagi]
MEQKNVDTALQAYNEEADTIRIEENLEELEAAMDVDTSTQDTPRIKLAPVPIPTFNGKEYGRCLQNELPRERDERRSSGFAEGIRKRKHLSSGGQTFEVQIRKQRTPRYATRAALGENKGQKQMEDQQKLCEEISSIVNQSQLKGEGIDAALLQQQVLSKFTETLQRLVLRKKRESDDWTTKVLLKTVEAHIQTELEIQR